MLLWAERDLFIHGQLPTSHKGNFKNINVRKDIISKDRLGKHLQCI